MPGLNVMDLIFEPRPDSYDDNIINEVIKRNIYQKHFPILSTDTVLDIGAHVGAFSCLAGSIADVVYSYEMNRENFKQLKKHLDINCIFNVLAVNRAVTIDGRNVTYGRSVGINTGSHSLYVHRGKGRAPEQARSVPIGGVLEHVQPTFVKMDCEGAEQEILDTVLDYHPNRMVIEYHFSIIRDTEIYRNFYNRFVKEYATVVAPHPDHLTKAWHSMVYLND